MRRPWGLRFASLLAGAVPLLAFPEPDLWWLAWVALVPWLLVVRGAPTAREAGVRSWCAAVGFLVATHYWLVSYLSVFAIPVFAAFGLLWLPWGRAAWSLRRRPVAALIVLPSGWVVIELVRSWEHLGGAWAALGTSQWNQPGTLAPGAIGGMWLVSWLVVAANVAVVIAVTSGGRAARVAGVAAAVVAAGIGPVWHALRPAPPDAGTLRIAVVQSGLGRDRAARFDAAVAATRGVARARPELVVWAESSVSFDTDRRRDVRARLVRLARDLDADLLVNVDARLADGGIRKSAMLVRPDGVDGRYDKTRLVPFGEYVPLRPLLGWIAGAADEDRRRGDGLAVLRARDAAVGPLVSFELAFPDMTRNLARRGAEVIVVQSMTSSFQGTWAPEQHASRAAVRAVETGRPVAHAALTGVSVVFDGRGEQLAWMGTGERGAVVVDVPLSDERTPYDRLGDWVPWGSVVVAAAALAGTLRSRRRTS